MRFRMRMKGHLSYWEVWQDEETEGEHLHKLNAYTEHVPKSEGGREPIAYVESSSTYSTRYVGKGETYIGGICIAI
eukprot:10775180-Ditylum_brightwellii.AAC.1